MKVDKHILALLLRGSKSFTELHDAIVPRICAKGTLSKHLKNLEKEGRIKRELFANRTTKYSLMPEYASTARSALDVITLESLIDELNFRTRGQLALEKVQSEKAIKDAWNLVDALYRMSEWTENIPRMNFLLQLDKETIRLANLTEPISKIVSTLEMKVREKLNEIKLKMPAALQEDGVPRSWNETKEFSHKTALKNGLRFLVVSWYDGKYYKQKVMNAIREIGKLEKDHQEDVSFLDEVDRRCFYSRHEYLSGPLRIIEELMSSLLDTLDQNQLIRLASLLCFLKDYKLMGLEVALISSASSILSDDVIKRKVSTYGFPAYREAFPQSELYSPYGIVDFNAYVKMKLPFLSEDEKRSLIAASLKGFSTTLKTFGELYSSDYKVHTKDYHAAINLLLEKLGIDRDKDIQADLQSPIMNFKFFDKKGKIDFSNEPLVRNFLRFKNDARKRKWLQKCLQVGLPVFPNIPFEKLGFKVENIL